MKYLSIFTLLFALGACSSAEEKREERQEEAREDYKEAQQDADDRYDSDVIDEEKQEAIDKIEDADSVDVDGDEINIED
jgi:hypothetical protein